MSNKTALQELFDKLETENERLCYIIANKEEYSLFEYNNAITESAVVFSILREKEKFLEKEKQQIMEAFKKGVTSCYDFKTSEEYFNSKYGNNGTTN